MEACRDLLTGLFEKTRPLAKQAETALQSNSASASAASSASSSGGGGGVSETVLAAMRLLPVVTREERAAIFLQVNNDPSSYPCPLLRFSPDPIPLIDTL